MVLLDKIVAFIEGIDEKQFYKYALGGVFIIATLVGIILIRHSYSARAIKRHISAINADREDVRQILNRFVAVEKQRADVNAVLAEEPDFKIGGYIDDLLKKQGLSNKIKVQNITPVEREGIYREVLLTLQLSDMNIQELTTLLDEIEQKRRIYVKLLQTTKSKKTPGTIEVTLTVGTLQLKEQPAG